MYTILIVDDHNITQRVLSHMLQKVGYNPLTAGSAQEALELLENETIDLAIFDIAMPIMNGITLLEKVRADEKTANLPVIMLTASGQDDDRMRAVNAGATAFLTKPARSDEVVRIIQENLRSD